MPIFTEKGIRFFQTLTPISTVKLAVVQTADGCLINKRLVNGFKDQHCLIELVTPFKIDDYSQQFQLKPSKTKCSIAIQIAANRHYLAGESLSVGVKDEYKTLYISELWQYKRIFAKSDILQFSVERCGKEPTLGPTGWL